MALTEKLTAIADAIRGKTGKTDGLTLDQMPGEIAGIQAGGDGGGGILSVSNAQGEVIAAIVEIGANNAYNLSTARAYFQGLLGTTANIISMVLVGDYGNIDNELVIKTTASGFVRWRSGALNNAGDLDGYDLRLAEGQHYFVYGEKRNT